MDSISTLVTSCPKQPDPSTSLMKTISSALVYILLSSATTYLFLLLHSSPRCLWITANAIIVFVYKLSSSNNTNNSEIQPELVTSISSPPSATWHKEPKPIHEKKEVGGEKDETLDDTWNGMRMRCASAANWKPYLQKSDTWEMRRQPRLQRADKVIKVVPRPELKKSATYTERRERSSVYTEEEKRDGNRDAGWRTRDVLVMAGHDELFRRVENFIKKQHDNLRLQRQESEHRRFLELSKKYVK